MYTGINKYMACCILTHHGTSGEKGFYLSGGGNSLCETFSPKNWPIAPKIDT